MLQHIKHIRSPIVVAQQKQAARKASGDSSSSKPEPTVSHARTHPRLPRLQEHPDASANVVPTLMHGVMAGASVQSQSGWPDVMSPVTNGGVQEDSVDWERSKGASDSEPSESVVPHTATGSATSDHIEIGTPAREVLVSAEISYAVAIYPYMAEQEDEFDVAVYVPRLVPLP